MAKLNTNSNTYIIIYSTILVVIVAFLLAFVSSSLKDKQEANVKLDKEKQVLNSLNMRDKDDAEAHELFNKVVTKIDSIGEGKDRKPYSGRCCKGRAR